MTVTWNSCRKITQPQNLWGVLPDKRTSLVVHAGQRVERVAGPGLRGRVLLEHGGVGRLEPGPLRVEADRAANGQQAQQPLRRRRAFPSNLTRNEVGNLKVMRVGVREKATAQ
jgi:hypothetical protein